MSQIVLEIEWNNFEKIHTIRDKKLYKKYTFVTLHLGVIFKIGL